MAVEAQGVGGQGERAVAAAAPSQALFRGSRARKRCKRRRKVGFERFETAKTTGGAPPRVTSGHSVGAAPEPCAASVCRGHQSSCSAPIILHSTTGQAKWLAVSLARGAAADAAASTSWHLLPARRARAWPPPSAQPDEFWWLQCPEQGSKLRVTILTWWQKRHGVRDRSFAEGAGCRGVGRMADGRKRG